MPVVESRNHLFQAAGHFVSEGFPEKPVSVNQGSRRSAKKTRPTRNRDPANTAEPLPGEEAFGSWLDRRYQYELEYFNPLDLLNSLSFLLTREQGALSFDIASGVASALHQHSLESCSWVVPGWPSIEMKSWSMFQLLAGGGMLSAVWGVHALVRTELWMGCPLCSMSIPLPLEGQIPHPHSCSQCLKDNTAAWHTVAATVVLRDALRACYLRNFLGQQNQSIFSCIRTRGRKGAITICFLTTALSPAERFKV